MRKTKLFQSVRHQYFYPELKRCPHCRQRLCLLRGLYLKKIIQTLDGVLWLGGYASHCVNPKCQYRQAHYLSTQLAALSLPGVTYGLDVIVRVGWRRQHDHRTMSEIGQELRSLWVQISDREVERLWDYYRLLLRGLSQADFVKLREAEQAYAIKPKSSASWKRNGLRFIRARPY